MCQKAYLVSHCSRLKNLLNDAYFSDVEYAVRTPKICLMNDVTLSRCTVGLYKVKNLSIFLDSKLSWNKHIRYVTANAIKLTGLIKSTVHVGQSAPVKLE